MKVRRERLASAHSLDSLVGLQERFRLYIDRYSSGPSSALVLPRRRLTRLSLDNPHRCSTLAAPTGVRFWLRTAV